MRCSAWFSDDPMMTYRYKLVWRWSDAPLLYVWMLNPSTADHEKTDNTIAGLIKRARIWDYGGLCVINLFAFRSKSPAIMKQFGDPVGPENDRMIIETLQAAASEGSPIIAGWGRHGRHAARDDWAKDMARKLEIALCALEINDDGSPKHPLYVLHATKPQPWIT